MLCSRNRHPPRARAHPDPPLCRERPSVRSTEIDYPTIKPSTKNTTSRTPDEKGHGAAFEPYLAWFDIALECSAPPPSSEPQ